jgi:hypothetical protein
MKASDFLSQAQAEMQDRAKTYDNPAGERSMQATVAAFNAITGQSMATVQGWLFMAILKAVRSQQGAYRSDSYTDMAAYAALMGECAAAESVEPMQFCTPAEIREALSTPDCAHAMKDYIDSEKYFVTVEEEEAWASLKPDDWVAVDFGKENPCEHGKWHYYLSTHTRRCIDCGYEMPWHGGA